ncbi:MAG: hypothetical protein LBU32_02895 [Clostridiales bacterium]|nr:hypothetical protein [Clostridiales bacterium]
MKAHCILRPPRRRSEAIQAVNRAPKDCGEMLKFSLPRSPILLRREESDSVGPPVFSGAQLGIEAGA